MTKGGTDFTDHALGNAFTIMGSPSYNTKLSAVRAELSKVSSSTVIQSAKTTQKSDPTYRSVGQVQASPQQSVFIPKYDNKATDGFLRGIYGDPGAIKRVPITISGTVVQVNPMAAKAFQAAVAAIPQSDLSALKFGSVQYNNGLS